MKKFVKILTRVIIILFFLYHILNVLFYYHWSSRTLDYADEFLSYITIVNAALGIPAFHDRRNIVIEDSKNRVDLSLEEWLSLENYQNPMYFVSSQYFNGRELTEEEIKKLESLGVFFTNVYGEDISLERYGGKSVIHELCHSPFTCTITTLLVNDYVLKYPDILKKMVRIIERPCDYIKKIEDAKTEREKDMIISYRQYMQCDRPYNKFWFNKKRPLVKLNIISERDNKDENQEPLKLIIRRKDIPF